MPDASIAFRPMLPGEEGEVTALVRRVFMEFEAPDYSPQGIEEFFRYANAGAMSRRADNHFVLVCAAGTQLAGMIEVRDYAHISLLFVDPAWQRRGIARRLFEMALAACQAARPAPTCLTVNSSPYAQPVYRRLGFTPTACEQVVNGIRFIPMIFVPLIEKGDPQ